MPRKPAVTEAELEVLEKLHIQLRLCATLDIEARISYYKQAKAKLGESAARLALMLVEANVPVNQVIHNYYGGTTVSQNNNPAGTNVTQTAGGNMTGVNATGDQKIRDISIFSQDLDQAGATINANMKTALIEARRSIETDSAIDTALKPMLIEQFDRLAAELAKGEKKNTNVLTGLWNMVYGAVKAVPADVAIAALEKLKNLLGF